MARRSALVGRPAPGSRAAMLGLFFFPREGWFKVLVKSVGFRRRATPGREGDNLYNPVMRPFGEAQDITHFDRVMGLDSGYTVNAQPAAGTKLDRQ